MVAQCLTRPVWSGHRRTGVEMFKNSVGQIIIAAAIDHRGRGIGSFRRGGVYDQQVAGGLGFGATAALISTRMFSRIR